MLEFLGSMNLAITLLVVIAIASVIGTVLKQNEPYQDYIIKFGTFWFEVFKALSLYDVYSAGWFLLIMGFLVASTSVCVYRNGPAMLRDMRAFRENITERSLRAFHNSSAWAFPHSPGRVAEAVTSHLTSYGYRIRLREHMDHTLLAAKKGSANRLGYLFTHIGIVVICIGGLVDGNMPLKIAEMMGKVRVETHTLPTSQVPAISRLPADNPSFRGLVDIPEGSVANHVDVRMRDGYLLQELPFTVEVKDFRVEQYPNGQPKSFESDLVIYDKDLAQPLHRTIAVNHPLIYKGYSIYQANFGDGGSKLQLRAWPLTGSKPLVEMQGAVSQNLKLNSPQGPLTVELEDFRLFNVRPAPPSSGKQFRDLGPSFTFKLRNADGVAREYENYMAPVEQNGRLFLISGMRENPNDEFSYLQIPSDPKGSVGRFMRFVALLKDKQKLTEIASQTARQSLEANGVSDSKVQKSLSAVMERLLVRFSEGGFEAVARYLQANLPQARREEAANAYAGFLQKALRGLYGVVLAEEGRSMGVELGEDRQFFDDAVNALGVIPDYVSLYYLQLANFQQIQASGLQITRAPGKNVVYAGFGMLIMGVFLMFYLPHRRLWAWIKPSAAGETSLVFAGSGSRDRIGFTKEYTLIRSGLEARLKALQVPPEPCEIGTMDVSGDVPGARQGKI